MMIPLVSVDFMNVYGEPDYAIMTQARQ